MTILAQPAVPYVNLSPIQIGKIIKLCYTEIFWKGGAEHCRTDGVTSRSAVCSSAIGKRQTQYRHLQNLGENLYVIWGDSAFKLDTLNITLKRIIPHLQQKLATYSKSRILSEAVCTFHPEQYQLTRSTINLVCNNKQHDDFVMMTEKLPRFYWRLKNKECAKKLAQKCTRQRTKHYDTQSVQIWAVNLLNRKLNTKRSDQSISVTTMNVKQLYHLIFFQYERQYVL
jgi:hypothetical protein